MRELAEHASGWREQTQKIDYLLRRAETPLFVVARVLRRQLLGLTLGQALRNAEAEGSALPYPVFAFSGAQQPRSLAAGDKTAIDLTALITLDYLGILDKVAAHFNHLLVAPSTFSLLFLDRQFIKLHQPSQLEKARRIHKLIANGRLKIVSGNGDETAAKVMGTELASLLALAVQEGGIVVRSAPVPKLNTLMEDILDMSPYASVLSDTLAVLCLLKDHGRLDAEDSQHAEAYLRRVDRGWSSPAPIEAGAKVYLDELAITYLDFVGLLEPLTRIVTVHVHADQEKRIAGISQWGEHAEELLSSIERIRAAVASGIASGRITFCRRCTNSGKGSDEDDSSTISPTLELMSDLSEVEVVIADDRCLTKLQTWTDASG
jgi:hypothetical protein